MGIVATSLGTWVNEKNAFAAYSGLHRNRTWENWIISNKGVVQKSNFVFSGIRSFFIFTTFSRIENTLSPAKITNNGYFPDPRGPYFYVALFLAGVTSIKSSLDHAEEQNRPKKNPKNTSLKQPEPTVMNQFLVGVSQVTPYLMIITNIFVNVIQIQKGEFSAWVDLAFTGISLIDISSWKPKSYEWFRDTVLDYPISAAAFYYANNKFRLNIIVALALKTETVKKLIQNPAQAQLIMHALLKRLGI